MFGETNMTGPSPEDISEMKKIMNALNNLGTDDYSDFENESSNEMVTESTTHRPAPPVMVGDEADEIRRLIRAMDYMMPDAVEDAKSNTDLMEAMITEKVDINTVQVGSWKIEKLLLESTNNDGAKYQVSNVNTKQRVEPVFVYESAQAILKKLNHGHNLNDKEIDAILELDDEYQRLRLKALEEKAVWQRAKNNNLEWKQQLYESKFNSSQYQALYIKERIKNFLLK